MEEIVCPFCEGTEFDYIESVVAFHKGAKISEGKIVIGKKPDDYWEASERGALLCANCSRKVSIPNDFEVISE